MSKSPSLETQVKNLRRELKHAKAKISLLDGQIDSYRLYLAKAEQETAEWRRRFDSLLKRDEDARVA